MGGKRRKTWKVLRWEHEHEADGVLELQCPCCEVDALLPTFGPSPLIIAAIGLSLVFDPPGARPAPDFMPDEIQCRYCRRIFTSDSESAAA